MDAKDLSQKIRDWYVEQVTLLLKRYFSDFTIPVLLAGYPIGANVRSEITWALAYLKKFGIDRLENWSIAEAIGHILVILTVTP